MSTQDSAPGPIAEALEADLSLWGATSGVLAQTARQIAAQLDSGASGLIDGSRELRQLVKAIREQHPGTGTGEVERFLADIAAEGFGRG